MSEPAANTRLRLEAAFDDHYTDVVAFLRRRLPAESVQDAAADVFLVAWKRIDEFPDGLPRNWLLGVAYRVASQAYRGTRRRRRLEEELSRQRQAVSADIEDEAAARDEVDVVFAAMQEISRSDRDLIQLAALDGLSHAEIGEIIGTSTENVAVRLSRARQRLRTRVEEIGESS